MNKSDKNQLVHTREAFFTFRGNKDLMVFRSYEKN